MEEDMDIEMTFSTVKCRKRGKFFSLFFVLKLCKNFSFLPLENSNLRDKLKCRLIFILIFVKLSVILKSLI